MVLASPFKHSTGRSGMYFSSFSALSSSPDIMQTADTDVVEEPPRTPFPPALVPHQAAATASLTHPEWGLLSLLDPVSLAKPGRRKDPKAHAYVPAPAMRPYAVDLEDLGLLTWAARAPDLSHMPRQKLPGL